MSADQLDFRSDFYAVVYDSNLPKLNCYTNIGQTVGAVPILFLFYFWLMPQGLINCHCLNVFFFNFFPINFAQFGAATVVRSVGWRDVCTNIQNYSLAIENIVFFFLSQPTDQTDPENVDMCSLIVRGKNEQSEHIVSAVCMRVYRFGQC